MPRRSSWLWTACLTVGLLLSALFSPGGFAAALPTPQLQSNTELATAGYFRLSWSESESSISPAQSSAEQQPVQRVYVLQQADNMHFTNPAVIYQGADSACLLSGYADGTRFYRVQSKIGGLSSGWSEPVQVEVRHHSLDRAVFFLIVGLVVFISTLLLIMTSVREQ